MSLADPPITDTDVFAAELSAIAESGPAARDWVERFRASDAYRLLGEIVRAMGLLRSHDTATAHAVLEDVATGLFPDSTDLAEPDDAGARLVRRWYLSARAYEEYLDGDLDAAEKLMDRARDAALEALDGRPFLVPFAAQMTDFDIQKARIARQRLHWDEVEQRLARVRRLFDGEEPLVELDGGETWTMDDVRAFFERTLPDGRTRSRLLGDLADPHAMERLETSVYTLPDFVIPYP